ncbi:MAG TPA: 5-oxoprolinase subunit PxpB, partial [Thermoanaerobaculia bacterium]|nr:5-oxoprolinase subunit PxpB [Thermoanaerobaculia bacterium]
MTPRRLLRDVRHGALLVEFPEASDGEANGAAVAIARRLSAASIHGFRDAIPAARTVLVLFDVRAASRGAVEEAIERAAKGAEPAGGESRLVRIPVAYGGAAALDLAGLARGAGLPETELARRHAAAEYRVAFLGFAPGFPYLTGLPAELRAARLPSPRPRVPAGSVAIGGPWTGVYPAAMPGGWRLIGRTSARLFDAGSAPPA